MRNKGIVLGALTAVLIVLVAFVFIYPSIEKDPPSTETSATDTEADGEGDDGTYIPPTNAEVTVSPKPAEQKYVYEEQTLILNYISYPVLTGSDEYSIDSINKALYDHAERFVFISNTKKAAALEDLQSAEGRGYEFEPYEKSASYSYYIYGNVLSVCFDISETSGGADGEWGLKTLCFDLVSGEEITLDRFTKKSQDEASELFYGAFMKMTEQNRENYFDDPAELILSAVDMSSFYLTENGLTLYIPSDVIAPSVMGIQRVNITYKELFKGQ